MAASTELDLAFSADPDLEVAPQLAAADYWQALLSAWLHQLAPELPAALQATAYSLGLNLVADAEIAELNADWRTRKAPPTCWPSPPRTKQPMAPRRCRHPGRRSP